MDSQVYHVIVSFIRGNFLPIIQNHLNINDFYSRFEHENTIFRVEIFLMQLLCLYHSSKHYRDNQGAAAGGRGGARCARGARGGRRVPGARGACGGGHGRDSRRRARAGVPAAAQGLARASSRRARRVRGHRTAPRGARASRAGVFRGAAPARCLQGGKGAGRARARRGAAGARRAVLRVEEGVCGAPARRGGDEAPRDARRPL